MRIGGAERVISNLIEHTNHNCYLLSILCLEKNIGPFGEDLKTKGYNVKKLDRNPGFDWTMILKIRSLIEAENIDILHCHQYTPYAYGVLAALMTHCKVVFTEHGRFYPDVRKIKRTLINPWLIKITNEVTAISEATRIALHKYENFPLNRIKVIYNGIPKSFGVDVTNNRNLEDEVGLRQNDIILGTVSRLDPIKNHSMIINALKLILEKHCNIRLLIVGDGPERSKLEKMVDSFGLGSKVIFTGYRRDTQRFYKLMDIFLLTSFSEGTAMTLLEAMATGLPCIATGVGGNPEIVLDGDTGFIVPSNDYEALAVKISVLLENPELRVKMGKAGRGRFEKHFTACQMAVQYEAIYDKLCGQQ